MNKMHKRHGTFRVSLLAAMVAATPSVGWAQDSDDAQELDTITITGQHEDPKGPAVGYKAERSLTATKTDTPLSETPRSISVVTRQQIEDQGAQTLSDLLEYVPGVSSANYPAGDALAGDIFYIRGMNQRDYGYGTYRDGLRLQPNAYATSAEPYGLARVEVLKGPTSILYGENVPGGMVNLVSKRPTYERQGEINLSYGTYDRKQFSLDVSGALNEQGSVRGRLVFLARDADTQTDSVPDNRIYFAPSLSIDLTDKDTLTLLTQYQKDETEIQLGLPAAGTLLDHPGGQLDTDTNLGHPDWDSFDREFWTLGYEYEHRFNDDWTFRQNGRYTRSLVDRQETWWSFPPALPVFPPHFPNGANGDGFDDEVLAYGRDRTNESRVYSIDNQLVGHLNAGAFENTVLAGVSYNRTSFSQVQYVGERPDVASGQLNDFQAIDIFDPQYTRAPATSVLSSNDEIQQDLVGGYAQLQTKVGGLIALVGGRYDWAESQYDDRTSANNDTTRTDNEFTWQTGLMYQFANGLSPYVNYATTFVPVQQTSTTSGDTFKPITGDQVEVGVKYEPKGWNTVVTVAAYDITKEDDVTYDSNLGDYRQIGETQSEGVEVEVKSDITDNLSMTAAYSYTDAEITEDAGSRYEDNQVTGVPRHQASVWANYSFHDGTLAGLETGLGVRYLGSSYAYPPETLNYGTLETEGETLVDAALGYDLTENWRAQVNVKNLFDRKYVAQCNNAGRCYSGAERSVLGTVSYNW
ncbi:TonB-dependent siderophore receptor [Chromohalobacter nigrandesensis]|uniref:TonB-dependent siderophore receptor n=1 Tax=Chromohalobacter nigrandesensis TaxID=119863 RepID=UPI001FF5CDA1|nr:TonB-dependent siderophore receptor [Chromohalobacter nigrandesensis]MCK0746447.1 TonB-dependent siderophore receptor [Chromohalobacter nigrandesensis]